MTIVAAIEHNAYNNLRYDTIKDALLQIASALYLNIASNFCQYCNKN